MLFIVCTGIYVIYCMYDKCIISLPPLQLEVFIITTCYLLSVISLHMIIHDYEIFLIYSDNLFDNFFEHSI